MRAIGVFTFLVLLARAPDASGAIWPSTAERVAADLTSNDVAVRRDAAERLSQLPATASRKLSRLALDDADVEVRLRGMEVALSVGVPDLADRVLPWLAENEPRLRIAAAEALARKPSTRAIGPLGRTLSDSDPAVRAAAARALGAAENAEAVLPLLGRLDDPVPEVREEVVLALSRLSDPRAVVPLIGKIEDPRPGVRRAVARALGELGDPRSVGALVLGLRDADDEVKAAVLTALGRIGDASAAPSVITLLGARPTSSVRARALWALGRFGTREANAVLLAELAFDEPGRERAPVLEALQRASGNAIPLLEACLAKPGKLEQGDGCALSLSTLGSQARARPIVLAMERGGVSLEVGLYALGQIGDAAFVPKVLAYLTHRDPRVSAAARSAAAKLLDPQRPDGRAVDPIAKALLARGQSVEERRELLGLLGRTGAARSGPVLLPFARDASDPGLRATALAALGAIGPSGQEAALLEAIADPHPAVRRAAALSLRRVGSAELAPELLGRMERSAEQDRQALAIALAGPLERTGDAAALARALALLDSSREGARDGLIEALSGVSAAAARGSLGKLAAHGGSAADRAKIAEALGGKAGATEVLRTLSRDADASVRANALWALGNVGDPGDVPSVERALSDRDVAVAANAAAALGRIAVRASVKPSPLLCAALGDARGHVRANALGALRLAGTRCDPALERTLLAEDELPLARRAAARLLGSVRSDELDRRALARCVNEEQRSEVAEVCDDPAPRAAAGVESVTVFVVPAGESAPVPRAPFALVFADGLVRHGVTDRRGAVYEPFAPRGQVELVVPAPLSR